MNQRARFVIAPPIKDRIVALIRERQPHAPSDAVVRADRILAGEFDLLGYRGLRFDRDSNPSSIDWHYDPVSRRSLPKGFWTTIDYLDPHGADHKVVWELNRHQHWLSLGRAYWLTGDSRYARHFISQLSSWIVDNPPLMTANWSSMLELGFRSLSWTWALNFFSINSGDDDAPWTVDLLLALDLHLTQIERHLSYYFSPNTHLLGEALALYVTGLALPMLRRSGERVRIGRRILVDEIDRQIAADGGHCERSTHYHRYTLDFYLFALAIARITGDSAAPEFAEAAGRLATAAAVLVDVNGRFPHLGDDDGGMLLPLCGREPDEMRDTLATAAVLLDCPDLLLGEVPEETLWIAGGIDGVKIAPTGDATRSLIYARSASLPQTGYYISRSAAGDHLVVDAGPLGYRNGGHAHADALSMTLSVAGTPLLIDSGTGCYTIDVATRNRFRSTPSHNTLVLDDRSQSVPAGPFHWSHSGDACLRRWHSHDGFDYFEGAHDGYRPIEHRRHVFVRHGDVLIVLDLVTGTGSHMAHLYWHLDPRWRVELEGQRATLFRPADGHCRHACDSVVEFVVADGEVEEFVGDTSNGLGWYSPAYGRIEPTTTLRVTKKAAAPFWIATVFGLDRANPIVSVESVPVSAVAGTFSYGSALRINRGESTDHFMVVDPAGATNAIWRCGNVETDASVLFGRTKGHAFAHAALVDGSFARAINLPGRQTDLSIYEGVHSPIHQSG